jgi:hypothetical protein
MEREVQRVQVILPSIPTLMALASYCSPSVRFHRIKCTVVFEGKHIAWPSEEHVNYFLFWLKKQHSFQC